MADPAIARLHAEGPVRENWSDLRQPRLGVMLHYDQSASDPGAVEWLLGDPRCRVSYNWLVLDNGNIIPIAPEAKRAWHAGVCRPSGPLHYNDANSAFYAISVAARAGEHATPAQVASVVGLCRTLFGEHNWSWHDTWRIVGHAAEAWPRGRKVDPIGPDPLNPVLSVQVVRRAVVGELGM